MVGNTMRGTLLKIYKSLRAILWKKTKHITINMSIFTYKIKHGIIGAMRMKKTTKFERQFCDKKRRLKHDSFCEI
jgi:hypothetical protein